jgi:hypothetical protein
MSQPTALEQAEFRRRVEQERGRGVILSKVGPWLIPCTYTECDHPARREHMFATLDGIKPLFYFFCSERHRLLWINSPKDLGNLPMGSRGTLL